MMPFHFRKGKPKLRGFVRNYAPALSVMSNNGVIQTEIRYLNNLNIVKITQDKGNVITGVSEFNEIIESADDNTPLTIGSYAKIINGKLCVERSQPEIIILQPEIVKIMKENRKQFIESIIEKKLTPNGR